ncbi:MAG: NAD-dependent dehydratase [Chloroflexi bacterium RBG_16_54_18]|nr:MAG: NAD-dependent dehydratase [Chloroflexi bacterium RBG_16_54_18]
MTGKVAVVTGGGANGGLGHAIASAFAQFGANLVIADIDDNGARKSVEEVQEFGSKAIAVHCDVSRPEEVENLFAESDKVFGKVDVLVNVPFWFPRQRPHELILEGWNKTLAICLTSYFLCSQQAIRRMLKQGSGGAILNIGSIAGASSLGRGNFAYSCAKAAVHQMTKELALEYASEGIRVNAILPCQVLTPGLKNQLIADPKLEETAMPRFLAGIPIGRLLDPDDFMGAAVFLCSDAARAVTGVLLPVDGGNLAMNAGGSIVWPKD